MTLINYLQSNARDTEEPVNPDVLSTLPPLKTISQTYPVKVLLSPLNPNKRISSKPQDLSETDVY